MFLSSVLSSLLSSLFGFFFIFFLSHLSFLLLVDFSLIQSPLFFEKPSEERLTDFMEPVEQDWKVSCSDDEGYGRIDSSNTSWEPPVKQIALLYQQLEKNGSLDLKWQCPGRRSPSVHSTSGQTVDKSKTSNMTDSSKPNSAVTEFDFDEEFADSNPATAKLSAPRRKNSSESRNFFVIFFFHHES